MWLDVWLNYFQYQMTSGVCILTCTCLPIALMLLPFGCYIVFCTWTLRWFDCSFTSIYKFILIFSFILLTLTVIACSRPVVIISSVCYSIVLVKKRVHWLIWLKVASVDSWFVSEPRAHRCQVSPLTSPRFAHYFCSEDKSTVWREREFHTPATSLLKIFWYNATAVNCNF